MLLRSAAHRTTVTPAAPATQSQQAPGSSPSPSPASFKAAILWQIKAPPGATATMARQQAQAGPSELWKERSRQLLRYYHAKPPRALRDAITADDLARATLLAPDWTVCAKGDEEDWPPGWDTNANSLRGVLTRREWKRLPTTDEEVAVPATHSTAKQPTAADGAESSGGGNSKQEKNLAGKAGSAKGEAGTKSVDSTSSKDKGKGKENEEAFALENTPRSQTPMPTPTSVAEARIEPTSNSNPKVPTGPLPVHKKPNLKTPQLPSTQELLAALPSLTGLPSLNASPAIKPTMLTALSDLVVVATSYRSPFAGDETTNAELEGGSTRRGLHPRQHGLPVDGGSTAVAGTGSSGAGWQFTQDDYRLCRRWAEDKNRARTEQQQGEYNVAE